MSGGSEVDGEQVVSGMVLLGMAAFDQVEVLGCGPGSALPSDLPHGYGAHAGLGECQTILTSPAAS